MQDYAHYHSSSQSDPTHTVKRSPVGFIYIIPLGLVLGFLLFLVSIAVRSFGAVTSEQAAPSPSPAQTVVREQAASPDSSPTIAEQKTPTPLPREGREKVRVLVLNGSGETGVAGKLKQELVSLGYTAVRTDNAAEFTYTDLTVQATSAYRAQAESLRQELAKTHTVQTVDEVASAAADVVVIVGK